MKRGSYRLFNIVRVLVHYTLLRMFNDVHAFVHNVLFNLFNNVHVLVHYFLLVKCDAALNNINIPKQKFENRKEWRTKVFKTKMLDSNHIIFHSFHGYRNS